MNKLFALIGVAFLAAGCATTPQPEAVNLEQLESLTPEQIRALPEAQMDALFGEASQNLEVFIAAQPKLSVQANSRWPNFAYTLAVALDYDYGVFKSDFYNKYEGPDWSTDGCSGPTPPIIFDDSACLHHDFGYANVAQYAQGRTDEIRKKIDERFLSDMKLVCDRRWSKWYEAASKLTCKAEALVFYQAVRSFGGGPYYDKTQRY
jgi:Prokaryotic phospholipase A2